MRKSISIVKATALEVLSEPLTLLVTLAALVLAVLAPAFHYHQFGDPTRMARDAGYSALFTCGTVVAVVGTVCAFRREIESGTLEMALAHPVSRTTFFLSKAMGVFLAYGVFALIVTGTTMVIFAGADIGGRLARESGDVARLFGPCLAAGVATLVLPLCVAAALNRFAGFRFVLSSMTIAAVLAVLSAGGVSVLTRGDVLRLVPVAVPLVALAGVFLSAAAACAVRFRVSVTAAVVGCLFLATVPALGNYYLVAALADGGALSGREIARIVAATLPAVAAFLLLGVQFVNGRDFQWTT